MDSDPVARGPTIIPDAVQGGTVTVLTHAGLHGSLDPAEVSARDLLSIDRGLLTRSLTQYAYDPATRQLLLKPDLATSLGNHNDDYTEWEFTIRRGASFENGDPVRARDVVRGIHRCLEAGSGPCRRYAGAFRSVRVVRNDVVDLHLTQPFPDLPYLAASPGLGPVPTRVAAASSQHRPMATGPYEITDYRPGRRLVLVRNPMWDSTTDPARTAYPDGYDFRAGVPTATIERTLLADSGTGQTTLTYDNLSAPAYARLSASARRRLVLGGQPCTTYVAIDNQTVTDPLVRRALALAYPYRAVVRLHGGIPGVTAVAATNLTPPGLPGRTALDPRTAPFQTEPRAARDLLRRAHALGFEITFAFDPSDTTSVRTKDALVSALRHGGFRARPETVDSHGVPRRSREDLRTTTRCGDWSSEGAWVPALFGTRDPSSPGGNRSAFARPAVDRRLAEILRLPLERQGAAYNRLEHHVLRRWFPAFPVSYGGVAMARGSRIEGLADDTTLGMPAWQGLWVAP